MEGDSAIARSADHSVQFHSEAFQPARLEGPPSLSDGAICKAKVEIKLKGYKKGSSGVNTRERNKSTSSRGNSQTNVISRSIFTENKSK